MKLASAFCVAVFCATSAYGEIQIAAETKHAISAIEAGQAVWIRCGACMPQADIVKARFVQAGYRVVGDDEADSADVRIIFVHGTVSIPLDGGGARNIDIDSIPANVGPIQPALTAEHSSVDASSNGSARGIDEAVVKSGRDLTGSVTGGILSGLAAARLAGWLASRQADATRIAGIGQMTVRVVIKGENNGFRLIFAATTPETPDTLTDAAFDGVIASMRHGLPAGRSFPLTVSH